MAKQNFTVHYGVTALEDGGMTINELAPALLAISDVFREIQE